MTDILIVEDDKELGEIMVEILSDFSESVQHVANGQRAVELLADMRPSLIFLDLHLPEISGVDILNFVHSQARLEKTRIVIMTADAFKADELRPLADEIIIKPISLDQVIDLAEKYL